MNQKKKKPLWEFEEWVMKTVPPEQVHPACIEERKKEVREWVNLYERMLVITFPGLSILVETRKCNLQPTS